jgi:hypothetical protein
MLRVVTAFNTVIGDTVDPTWNSPAAVEPSVYNVAQLAALQCRLAKRHGGKCADAMHAFNGKDGRKSAQAFLNPADATHLAQSGHDTIAKLVVGLGFEPLQAQEASMVHHRPASAFVAATSLGVPGQDIVAASLFERT